MQCKIITCIYLRKNFQNLSAKYEHMGTAHQHQAKRYFHFEEIIIMDDSDENSERLDCLFQYSIISYPQGVTGYVSEGIKIC